MNKLKGIILVVFLSLASIMMPFNVYADSLTSANINGVNIILDEVTYIDDFTSSFSGGTLKTERNYFNYIAEIQLDDSYLGYLNITISYSYSAYNSTGLVQYNSSQSRKVFVNGDSTSFSFGFVANSSVDPVNRNSVSYTLGTSDVTSYGMLSSLEQIIDILVDCEDLLTDNITELEKIVSNTSLANTYLDSISQIKSWNVPLESLPFTYSILTYEANKIVESINHYYSEYPIISLVTRNYLYAVYSTNSTGQYYLIFGTDSLSNTIPRFQQYFEITNANIISITPIYNSYFRYDFYVVKFERISSGYCYFRNIANVNFIPVYMASVDNKNISTDFALRWGLSNSFLDNIQIIANGTNESNSAVSGLDSSNSTMASNMNDLATIESGYNQSFNDQIQRIDFSNPIQNNAGLLPAANFVISIFNGLINNNPLSVLIIICCVLLIGKKVIGK